MGTRGEVGRRVALRYMSAVYLGFPSVLLWVVHYSFGGVSTPEIVLQKVLLWSSTYFFVLLSLRQICFRAKIFPAKVFPPNI